MRWAEFEAEAPELAALVAAAFAVRKHATMATLRRDGGPRISGTEVEFADGELWLGSMPGALKARDLRRDPRVAIHSPTVDPASPSEWAGEAKVAGTVVEEPEGSFRFRVVLGEAVHTGLGGPDHLLIQSWHPGRGVERHQRR